MPRAHMGRDLTGDCVLPSGRPGFRSVPFARQNLAGPVTPCGGPRATVRDCGHVLLLDQSCLPASKPG